MWAGAWWISRIFPEGSGRKTVPFHSGGIAGAESGEQQEVRLENSSV